MLLIFASVIGVIVIATIIACKSFNKEKKTTTKYGVDEMTDSASDYTGADS